MARTRASVGAKVSSGKSSKARCSVAPPAASSGNSSNNSKAASTSGGNPVCPRETPNWQKPITNFFVCMDPKNSQNSDDGQSPESSRTDQSKAQSEDKDALQARNIEEEINIEDDTPKPSASLDNSSNLEPLNGESCRKIEEFFPKNGVKGKGVGKKSKGKENKRSSSKRDLESDDDEDVSVSKKIKVK